MICRRPIVSAAFVAASLVLAPAVVPASTLFPVDNPTSVHYLVSIPGGVPAAASALTTPEVIFAINPVGAVAASSVTAANPKGSPLSIALDPFVASDGNTYTTSGFDTSKLGVFLKDIPASNGSPAQQYLGLSFLDQGLAKGGALDFTLNKSNPSAPDPTLTLSPSSPTAGVSFLQLAAMPPPPAAAPGSSTTLAATSAPTPGPIGQRPPVDQPIPGPSVPEPASLALWSVVAAGGLLHARVFRRRQVA